MGNDPQVSSEELKAEQDALQEAQEEEVRKQVIAEYGFDEIDHAELIEKATKREMEHAKTRASLTKQKVGYRTKYEELSKKPPEPPKSDANADELAKRATEAALAAIDEREFDSLNIPDEIKAEAKKVAKALGVSPKKALEEPFLKYKLDEAKREGKIEEATISRTNQNISVAERARQTSEKNPNPKGYDLNTEEGRAKWVEDRKK